MLKNIWTAIDPFRPASIESDSIVHYFWANKLPAEYQAPLFEGKIYDTANPLDEPLCTVPLKSIDRAFENARRYPNTEFRLWIDYARLDVSSKFFVESHFFINAPSNIKIHDFSKTDVFEKMPEAAKKNIWGYVDMARLLILANAFDTTQKTYQFYSDFVAADVKLNDPHATRSLKKHGVFFGRTVMQGPWVPGIIENGFMAFARGAGEVFLRTSIIPTTLSDVCEGVNGFNAYKRAIDKHFLKNQWGKDSSIKPKHISGERLQPLGYKLPDVPLYRVTGINL